MPKYIQNPVRIKARMMHGKAWALWAWLQEVDCIARWSSCDGQTIEGIIDPEKFPSVLPKLQRFAWGPVEFATVGR